MSGIGMRWAGWLLAAFVVQTSASLLALTAYAQSASQVTPPTFLPPRSSGGGVVIGTPEQAPLTAPADVAGASVQIAGVRVVGLFPEVAADARRVLDRVKGRRLSVTELYAIASAIEQLHLAAGYVLARVIIPPQEIVDGSTFTIEVIDGFIEAVEGEQLPERVRGPVLARTSSLVGKRHVTLAEIERRVLLAGDVPGLQLSSALARGKSRGGTRLILQGTHAVMQGTLVSDNRLNPSLGGWQHTASVWVNSGLGLGEQLYGTAAGSGDILHENSRLKMFAAGLVIPLGRDGLTLNPEFTQTESSPMPAAGAPETNDLFQRLAVRMSYPFVRTRSVTLSAQTVYEHNAQQSEAIAFNTLLSRDEYDVLRNGLQLTLGSASGGTLAFSAQLSNGLTGRTQADATAQGVPLSRQNSGPQFSKMSGEILVSQMLPQLVRLQVSARAQASHSGALLKSEQFSLEGADILTGWVGGTFLVDQGVAARAEISRRFEISDTGWLKAATPYVFAATGHGQLFAATAAEVTAVTATSLGFGMRGAVNLPGTGLGGFTALELAKRYTDDPNRPSGWRGVVSFGVRF